MFCFRVYISLSKKTLPQLRVTFGPVFSAEAVCICKDSVFHICLQNLM